MNYLNEMGKVILKEMFRFLVCSHDRWLQGIAHYTSILGENTLPRKEYNVPRQRELKHLIKARFT